MDFLYKKYPKGTYEYADYKKKIDIVVMIVFFALAIGLYITGYVSTGSNRNLLTIVAVLGLLPACKMVVDVVMCFRVKKCSPATKEKIDAAVGKLTGMYNMYFTSYDKNYSIDHLVVTENSIIGLSLDSGFDEKEFQAHLNDLLRKDGIKDIMIKIFNKDDKYIARLEELNALEDADKTNSGVLSLIYNVTI